jgi:hypothetical protein
MRSAARSSTSGRLSSATTQTGYARRNSRPNSTSGASAAPRERPDDPATLAEEERAHRLYSRGGRRWRQLREHDERIARHQRTQDGLRARAAELRERLTQVEREDAERAAAWLEAGQRGDRPRASVPDLRDELDQIEADAQAMDGVIDKVLAEKVEHVERHRPKLSREARSDTDAAHARYVTAAKQLAQARAKLLEARATELWLRYWPSEEARHDPLTMLSMLAGGLLRPVESTLGVRTNVPFANVPAAIEANADTFCAYGLRDDSRDAEPDPHHEAIWEQTDKGRKAMARANKRIREGMRPRHVHEAGWGD